MTHALELLIGTLLVAALLWFARCVWHLTRFYWYRLRVRRECAPIDRISLEAMERPSEPGSGRLTMEWRP